MDVMWVARKRMWGVQRKTWADLLASVADDRLAKEVEQSRVLDHVVLVLEGRPTITAEGSYLIGRQTWTAEQVLGLRLSIQSRGWWIEQTANVVGTAKLLGAIQAWSKKERHTSLDSRSQKAKGVWGMDPTDRAFAVWVCQSIPGVGPELGKRIYDLYGMPFGWKVTEAELGKVKGIGKKRAARIYRAIGPLEQLEDG